MSRVDGPAIQLCGNPEVAPRGRDVSPQLPGRQGRLLLAYLACKRGRPVTRDELIDLLWPSDRPALPDEVFGSLLSKLRRAVGPRVIEGRHDLTLRLGEGTGVDVEIAAEAVEHAEAALAGGEAGLAFARAKAAWGSAASGAAIDRLPLLGAEDLKEKFDLVAMARRSSSFETGLSCPSDPVCSAS